MHPRMSRRKWSSIVMKARHERELRALMAVVVAVLIGVAACPAHAQQNTTNSNSMTDLSAYLVSGSQVVPLQAIGVTVPQAGLSSSVTQIGQGNVASTSLSGIGNVTTQYQAGQNNSSTLSISGTQNTITTTQIGSANTTAIDIAGNGNSISNLQVGTGLSYQLQVIGKSVPVSVQQYGRK
jgi:hypothetical protein